MRCCSAATKTTTASGARSPRLSPAGLTKRKCLPAGVDPSLLSDLERCCRCKNQWNKLAGRNKRAAASEPSKAKRVKLSPAAPGLAKAKPVRATELCCDRCGAWYPTSEIGVSAEVASLMDFVCGVCKGTHKPV